MDEGTRRCCQHRACVDWDLHELYAMSKKSERPAEKDSTTVAAPIGAGPMSPAVVRVDEAVGVDDGDAAMLATGWCWMKTKGWMGSCGG